MTFIDLQKTQLMLDTLVRDTWNTHSGKALTPRTKFSIINDVFSAMRIKVCEGELEPAFEVFAMSYVKETVEQLYSQANYEQEY